jgi:ribosomal protein S27AE
MTDLNQEGFFKIKPTKKSNPEERTTLDVIHHYQLNKIITEKDDISILEEQCQELESDFNRTADELEKGQIEIRLEELRSEISKKNQKDRVYDYFLETGDVLFKYYEIQDAISQGAAGVRQKVKRKPGDVLSALEDAAKNDIAIQEPESEVSSIQTMTSRDKLLHQYLQKVNPSYNKKNTDVQDTHGECLDCGQDMIFAVNEAMLYCKECGNTEFILIDSDRPSYKDPPRESSYYAYKRINHFNELLAQFQAKGTTDIPQEVFDAISNELKKQRILEMKGLKQEKVREILRKLKLNKFYDNVPNIINRLNGNTAPVMDRETEEKLRHMFKEIQPSFQKHCPKNRRNFLSYAYVMYKFCELLELDDFLKNFHLLKNRDKLYLQDKIWKCICDEMGWEFIRSI